MDNMLQVPTISYKPIPQQALAFKEAVHARATATPQNHEIHEHPVPFPWAPNEKVPVSLYSVSTGHLLIFQVGTSSRDS